MKPWIVIGGPIAATLIAGYLVYSGVVVIGDLPEGIEHQAGVDAGGSLAIEHKEVYQCDEGGENCVLIDSSTEFSDVAGLEYEEEPIEYRDGLSSEYNKTKQSGIAKYANIHIRRPIGFNWKNWKFMFERQVAIEAVEKEYDEKFEQLQQEQAQEEQEQQQQQQEQESDEDGEMYQIDPPVLVIPAG